MQSVFCLADFVIEKVIQIFYGFPVTVQSVSLDGFAAGKTGIGDLPEGFPGIHIGNMNFHSRNGNSLQSIQNGNGCMGISSRVDDDAIDLAIAFLNLVHKAAFMIGLILLDFDTFFFCGSFKERK